MTDDMDTILIDETLPVLRSIHNDPSAAPWGMLGYDRGALSSSQQEELNFLKTTFLRRENRRYLMAHPQVSAVVSVILRAVYLQRPNDPKKFIAELVGRSDFEDKVRHYLSRNGPSSQVKRSHGVDLFSCINPELLVGKQTEIYPEKQRISLDITDEDPDLRQEWARPVDSPSTIDPSKVISGIGEDAINLERNLDEAYRLREEAERKMAKNILKFESDKKSMLPTEPANDGNEPRFSGEP